MSPLKKKQIFQPTDAEPRGWRYAAIQVGVQIHHVGRTGGPSRHCEKHSAFAEKGFFKRRPMGRK
jgi:hypothetical protein